MRMTDRYQSPLSERYASKEMQYIFSPDMKFRTWRKLWIALAETEKELGLNITDEQIEELKAHADDINYEVAKEREKVVRHDVMSHVYAYGVQCPKAKGIIHLGATSCYVGDNTDIIVMTEALKLVQKKLINVIAEMAKFADEHKELPTLAFTHFQPAQPTTVGKRATLWMQEFMLDLEDLNYVLSTMKLLGSKGTTGTQASFLELFDGDQEKIDKIDPMIAEKMGFKECYPVSGQTYSRKVDTRVINVLAGIAASAHKFSNDIRLLQHLKEVEEPFEKTQIGSSAMAYKRNPMRSERIASLSRFVMVDALNPAITSATQWFERTLDDSANKRLSVPEAFLAIDGILDLCLNVVDGLVVYPKVIEKHLRAELPFMATENIMMDAVKAGGDRQELHEKIRTLSMEAGKNVKERGLDNNLLELIAADPAFNMSLEDLQKTMDPAKYTGRAKEQVTAFLTKVVNPVLESHKEILGMKAEINV
ncbi:MAG: adenylosuccinate lyase [Lachnospiraceae bacterium]|nr:adenylosuccinate lyase [Lachnospiraceae bacterium]